MDENPSDDPFDLWPLITREKSSRVVKFKPKPPKLSVHSCSSSSPKPPTEALITHPADAPKTLPITPENSAPKPSELIVHSSSSSSPKPPTEALVTHPTDAPKTLPITPEKSAPKPSELIVHSSPSSPAPITPEKSAGPAIQEFISSPKFPNDRDGGYAKDPFDLQNECLSSNSIAIHISGSSLSISWILDSTEGLLLKGKFIKTEFRCRRADFHSPEDWVPVFQNLREKFGDVVCFLVLPLHLGFGPRSLVKSEVISAGFTNCFFLDFQHALALGYIAKLGKTLGTFDSGVFVLFLKVNKKSFQATLAMFKGLEISIVRSLYDHSLKSNAGIQNESDYLGNLKAFLAKFFRVSSVISFLMKIVVVGGIYHTAPAVVQYLRSRFSDAQVGHYNLETITTGAILLVSATGDEVNEKGKELELDIGNLRIGVAGCSVCISCGGNLISYSLDGKHYTAEGDDLLWLEHVNNLEYAEAAKDEAYANVVDSARDELFGEGEYSESFDRAAMDSYNDFCQGYVESIVGDGVESPVVYFCEECQNNICSECKLQGCKFCSYKSANIKKP